MRHGGRSEEQLASCCLQIPISRECHTLSGIFHFPKVSLTSVTNQEAWKWPMKAAMAPNLVPVCSQLKLVQAETSSRMQGEAAATRAATALVLELCRIQEISGSLSSSLAVISMAGEQIPPLGLSQLPNPGLHSSQMPAPLWRADPAHLTTNCTGHCHQSHAWQPDLAPCLAAVSQHPRDLGLNLSGHLAWKLAGCKHFCHYSKAFDFSFPVKQLCFSARLGEVLIAPACGHTANGSSQPAELGR